MNYRTPETHSSNSSKYKHHEERGREICFHTNLPVTPFFFLLFLLPAVNAYIKSILLTFLHCKAVVSMTFEEDNNLAFILKALNTGVDTFLWLCQ